MHFHTPPPPSIISFPLSKNKFKAQAQRQEQINVFLILDSKFRLCSESYRLI